MPLKIHSDFDSFDNPDAARTDFLLSHPANFAIQYSEFYHLKHLSAITPTVIARIFTRLHQVPISKLEKWLNAKPLDLKAIWASFDYQEESEQPKNNPSHDGRGGD